MKADVAEVIPLRRWAVMYFDDPDCYQHFRADIECLLHKKRDGRAFWPDGARVLFWCVCCEHAEMVQVEQPATIFNSFYRTKDVQGSEVHDEYRTTHLGDTCDKFVRLTCRNVEPDWPPMVSIRRLPSTQLRSHFTYLIPDERDKASSSWVGYPEMCKALAHARQTSGDRGASNCWLVQTCSPTVRVAMASSGVSYPVPDTVDIPLPYSGGIPGIL